MDGDIEALDLRGMDAAKGAFKNIGTICKLDNMLVCRPDGSPVFDDDRMFALSLAGAIRAYISTAAPARTEEKTDAKESEASASEAIGNRRA